MTPLCFNTNSAERKSCPPLGRDEGRVVCVVWEPSLQSTGKVGPRLPALQGRRHQDDTVHGPAVRVLQLSPTRRVLFRTPKPRMMQRMKAEL